MARSGGKKEEEIWQLLGLASLGKWMRADIAALSKDILEVAVDEVPST